MNVSAGLNPFHLAIPVHSLAAARSFYGELLGCREGRSDKHWVDFDLYGHQLVCHLASSDTLLVRNEVDGEQVPVPHFGVVLDWTTWEQLANKLRDAKTDFVIAPGVRFLGEPGEQATMFLLDPSGNALEFKAMRQPENLFAK